MSNATPATRSTRLTFDAVGGLHPSTSPEAIAADQRAAVREALETLGPGATAEQVSELAVPPVLPVNVVVRRMAELRRW